MKLVKATLLGAAAMFFLDPQQGRRRRALTRDKVARFRHRMSHDTEVMVRDLRNRVEGFRAELNSALHSGPVPDDQLVERVRAKIGRVVTSPRVIEVIANDSVVTVRGPVPASEVADLIATVWRVPGVKNVHNELDVREHMPPGMADPKANSEKDIDLGEVSPATRLVIGTIGSASLLYGILTGRALCTVLGTVGLAVCMVPTAKPELERLLDSARHAGGPSPHDGSRARGARDSATGETESAGSQRSGDSSNDERIIAGSTARESAGRNN